jgi:hypothetical protein
MITTHYTYGEATTVNLRLYYSGGAVWSDKEGFSCPLTIRLFGVLDEAY